MGAAMSAGVLKCLLAWGSSITEASWQPRQFSAVVSMASLQLQVMRWAPCPPFHSAVRCTTSSSNAHACLYLCAGTCCAGHFHAYKVEKKDKKTGVTSILCNCKVSFCHVCKGTAALVYAAVVRYVSCCIRRGAMCVVQKQYLLILTQGSQISTHNLRTVSRTVD